MEQKTRLATITSNRAVEMEKLVGGKLCFLDTKNLKIELVQTTDEARHPKMTTIELPQTKGVNDRGGVHGVVVRRQAAPDGFLTGKEGRWAHNESWCMEIAKTNWTTRWIRLYATRMPAFRRQTGVEGATAALSTCTMD